MAKQVGPIFYEGTIGDIVFYQMDGEYYARFKGNYKSRKQMERIPKFKPTLHYAKQFGKASKIASWIYQRHLSKELRSRKVFNSFTAKATKLINKGKSEKDIKATLIAYCEQLTLEATAAQQAVQEKAIAISVTNPKPATQKPETSNQKQETQNPIPSFKIHHLAFNIINIPLKSSTYTLP